MTRAAEELLQQALELPVSDRAKIAAELLASIEDVDDRGQEAWAAEIEARAAAVREGRVESTDWRVVLDEIEQDLLRR